MERNDKARVQDTDEAQEGDERPADAIAADGGAATVAGLECRVGKAPIVVPVAHVAQIIEYETSPLPLTRRWITGAGIHGERLVITVGLVTDASARPPAARRRTKGILLNAPDDGARGGRPGRSSPIAWALEVQEVLVLVRATVLERRRGAPRAGELPSWISRARTTDGRSMGWIDVPAMLSEMQSSLPSPAPSPLSRPLP